MPGFISIFMALTWCVWSALSPMSCRAQQEDTALTELIGKRVRLWVPTQQTDWVVGKLVSVEASQVTMGISSFWHDVSREHIIPIEHIEKLQLSHRPSHTMLLGGLLGGIGGGVLGAIVADKAIEDSSGARGTVVIFSGVLGGVAGFGLGAIVGRHTPDRWEELTFTVQSGLLYPGSGPYNGVKLAWQF